MHNQHAQAHNQKMLSEVGFDSQTGLLLQSAHTGTQQENAQSSKIPPSGWITAPAQAHNKKMLGNVEFHRQIDRC